jgi:glycosyltransferase involved in cell wall biosynthesis
LSVVIPAYNEGAAIGGVLAGFAALPYHVVVVDDGSADDTGRRALQHPVTVLRHVCNLGQGAALQTGITYALRLPGVRFVVTFDSDGQHAVADIERLLEPLRTGAYDVALGSRFLSGEGAVDISAAKRVVLRLAVWFTKVTSGLRLTDTHNGLRALTAEAAARVNITSNRMAHASELLSQIALLRLRYREVPVTVTYTEYSRRKGQSLLNAINILWDIAAARIR